MASNSSSSSSSSSSTTSPGISSSIKSFQEVRKVGIEDYLQATDCLAQAFRKDDICRYLVGLNGDDAVLKGDLYKLHYDILKYTTAAHCLKGVVTTVGDFDAVALWMPPGKNMDDWWTIIRSGMWRLLYKLPREGKVRLYREFHPLLHDTKLRTLGKHVDSNSLYLVYLGTKPGSEKKGYGRALLEQGCAMADQLGIPTYLESSAAPNVAFYEKSGFSYVKEVYLQRGEKPVALSIMVREPKGVARRDTRSSKGSESGSSVKEKTVHEFDEVLPNSRPLGA